ncbi:conserved hypothetical protein [Ricinus communis]|uniref:Uncharacterized protein n=1 Tax=Ricinus communis TaxID=3988 RepID=B9RWY0_RICCO|nr:conserved hypothetical protein [Ricinus communis]
MASSSSTEKQPIEDAYASLSITEEKVGGLEIGGHVLSADKEDFWWCLVGRFLIDKGINFTAIKYILASL